jgi:DNA-binding response OmpR family regulator
MPKILLVEDDMRLCDVVRESLESENHSVEISHDGSDAVTRLRTYEYDLVVLDWDLPFLSGIDVLKQFRSRGGTTPILMLTGKSHIDEKEIGFDSGVDDYLTKPFQLREFKARIKALLRRPAQLHSKTMKAGQIVLDPALFKVTKAGNEVPFSKKEFAILEFLMRHPKQVYSAEALLRCVWKAEDAVGPETVKTHVKNIRAKLHTPGEPSLLTTVFGIGYKVDVEVE